MYIKFAGNREPFGDICKSNSEIQCRLMIKHYCNQSFALEK